MFPYVGFGFFDVVARSLARSRLRRALVTQLRGRLVYTPPHYRRKPMRIEPGYEILSYKSLAEDRTKIKSFEANRRYVANIQLHK